MITSGGPSQRLNRKTLWLGELKRASDPLAPRARSPKRSRWPIVVGLVILAGYLLFAHGCHGGEDDDLFAARATAAAPASASDC
jgi:hypothetical protein